MERLEFAREIVRIAGEITLKYFYAPTEYSVQHKADASPVTVADLEAERFLRNRIKEQFPNDTIQGEEFSEQFGSSGFKWLLDPIDGTKSFIHGVPLYSMLVGLECDGISVGGVIGLPALGEMIWAGKGTGAWHETTRCKNPVQAKVSNCRNIADAVFLTSEVLTYNKAERRDDYENLEKKVLLTRTWGDAYGYFLVATGRAEIMVDPILSDWDAAPLMIILEEAGGKFTDWKGNRTIYGKEGIGTNGFLHEEVLQILRKKNESNKHK
ncbi:MAG: inositol monophosphatase family protein [Planctomycetaceae bacterium]|jgi:histidinol phosphatase-like enzyme (inositol monophosphatase family)|nr:inositol monophosphatase family protein [Planctomycetaceae bacterium]